MSEMVERVAAAIAAVPNGAIFSRFNDWTSDHVPGLPVEICRTPDPERDEIEVIARYPATGDADAIVARHIAALRARAAIEAMREPTEGMIAAGSNHVGYYGDEDDARKVWSAMADAALNETATAS